MRRMHGRVKFTLLVLLGVAGVVLATSAHAQALQDASGSFAGLLELIQNNANAWADRLRGYAIRVFWSLATIQLVWTFFPLVIRNADFGEIVGELVRFILVIGFFYALLIYSVDWATAVVESFRIAGGTASGLGRELRPGDMFGLAVELAKTIGDVETWNPLAAMMIALAGLVVLLCFAFIAAFMGVTIVESYIVINASVLFLGFGGSQWTREYALAMARYAIAVGAKLFVLTLLVGLLLQAARQWQAAYNYNDASMWTMVGLSLVCAYLSKQIPDLVQSLITGTSMGGGAALGSMAAASLAGAAAAAATITTAGAAAPAAGTAAGAAGGAGSAAGGGLASLINSSLMGGSAAGTSATGTGTSGLAASSAGAPSLAPRVGGAGISSPAKPGAAASTPTVQQTQGKSTAAASSSQSGQPQAASQSGQSGQSGSAADASPSPVEVAPPPAQPGESGGITGRQIASGLLRGTGILSAISVPGMESAAGLSLGPHPLPANADQEPPPGEDFRSSPNVIAPADPDVPPSGTAPSPAPSPAPNSGKDKA